MTTAVNNAMHVTHTLPVITALRGHMQRRRRAVLYCNYESGDPALRALVAAEASLQLLLDFVLLPSAVDDQLPLALDVQIAVLVETLSHFAMASLLPGQIAPLLKARTYPLQVPMALGIDLVQALMVVLMESLSAGASMVYVSMSGQRATLALHVETDVALEVGVDAAHLLARHGGSLSAVDHTTRLGVQADTEHWEMLLTMPLAVTHS